MMRNSVTFNVCSDNGEAAAALVEALVAKGHQAELLDVPAEGLEHARACGQKSPPAAVAHDAPASVVIPLMTAIEKQHAGEKFRPESSSPRGPFGPPPQDRDG